MTKKNTQLPTIIVVTPDGEIALLSNRVETVTFIEDNIDGSYSGYEAEMYQVFESTSGFRELNIVRDQITLS